MDALEKRIYILIEGMNYFAKYYKEPAHILYNSRFWK